MVGPFSFLGITHGIVHKPQMSPIGDLAARVILAMMMGAMGLLSRGFLNPLLWRIDLLWSLRMLMKLLSGGNIGHSSTLGLKNEF